MKYLEYIWLLLSLALIGVLVWVFRTDGGPSLQHIILLLAGIILSSFMFSFRRRIRQIAERDAGQHKNSE